MPEKTHWPFTGNIWANGNRKNSHAQEADEEKARLADLKVHQARVRHDRLIVGGRAHTKKAGLS